MVPCETAQFRLELELVQNQDWTGTHYLSTRVHSGLRTLLKLRFFVSQSKRNSARDQVIGNKWIYLQRNTLHIQSEVCFRRWEARRHGMVSFYGLCHFIGWVGGLFQLFRRRGRDFQELSHLAHFCSCSVRTVRLPVGVSFRCWCITMSLWWDSRSTGSRIFHYFGPSKF